jgi:uncharacterized protein
VDELAVEGELTPGEALLSADDLRLSGPLHWSLRVTNTGGDDDFVVVGRVVGTALMECRRCLSEVPTRVDAALVYPMVYRPGDPGPLAMTEGEEQDELLVFAHPEVDFAALLTQLFAIDLPLTVLCRQDCRGLSVDGVNLNEHPEHRPAATRGDRPSPFDALKDLDI